MRKSMTIGIVLFMILVTFTVLPMNISAAGEYSSYFAGGDGTAGNPYQIADVDQLQNMQLDLDAHYILLNDIDASGTSTWNSDGSGGYYGFKPIGKFIGSLDGQGYTITELFINRGTTNYVGLFGYIDSGGSVSNVGLIDNDLSGNGYVGGLVGVHRGVVSKCYATGTVTAAGIVGGLMGWNYGTVKNCYATGIVSGNGIVGGLVGENYKGWNVGIMENCYATGDVSGTSDIGGFVGRNGGIVEKCFATGSVSGDQYVGGLVGYNYGVTASNSYWDTETSGQSSSSGGIGKTTAEMKKQSTFVDWDFTNIWAIKEDVTYPYFQWQITNQPPVADAGGPYEANECSEITFDASDSSDPDDDELQYRWDFDNDGEWDTEYSTDPTATHTWDDDYSDDVTVLVTDGTETDTATALVTINNVAPTASIDDVVQPYSEFIMPTDILEFQGGFTDPGTLDTHTIEWDFGDGNGTDDTLTPTHVYTQSGIYTLTLTVTDDDGGVGDTSVEIVVESPEEATEDVLENMVDMELQNGMNESLSSKLENVIELINDCQDLAAVNVLEAFINQVEAQRGKKLTEEEADALIAAAQWIIDNVEENGT
jgi:hypothetical protein